MITENYQVVSGAYGRDYKSAKLAKEDFLNGADFVLNSFRGTTYCSVRDFAKGTMVNIRYKGMTMVTTVKVS